MCDLEIEMSVTGDVRRFVALLAKAVIAGVGATFTGKVTITFNFHNGTLGRVTTATEEVHSAI